jgi:KaiC/GvpD/RAD55 family RecA-like ATPase
MVLVPGHRDKLVACGLSAETWQRAQLHSGTEAEVRNVLGWGVGPGLVIPYAADYARVRIDHPGPDGKRYRSPARTPNRLYVPPTLPQDATSDVTRPLYITEGEFKALKATQEGFACVALAGVWSWKTKMHGRSLPIPALDGVVWARRRVVVVFDSDLVDKPAVAWAEHHLVAELRRREADVYVLRLPAGPKGEKYGLDDYLVAEGIDAFRALPMVTLAEADAEASPFLRVSDLADAYMLRATRPDARLRLGYGALDEVLRGVAAGEVMTILGRAGVGKTAFGLNLIDRMTAEHQSPTLMLSLEQPGVELFERMVSIAEALPGEDVERRVRSEDPTVLDPIIRAVKRWSHVVVVERPCSIDQVDRMVGEATASALWRAPLRLVVVDYLGLVSATRPGKPYEMASQVAREMKTIAKRHRVAVLLLAQITREGGSGGEPVSMTMARESGVIEEAADYILGIWRPELRDTQTKDERERVRGEFKVKVLKNRHGRSGRVATLRFERAALRIQDTGLVATTTGD